MTRRANHHMSDGDQRRYPGLRERAPQCCPQRRDPNHLRSQFVPEMLEIEVRRQKITTSLKLKFRAGTKVWRHKDQAPFVFFLTRAAIVASRALAAPLV
jgi:hypothetical protein